MKNISSSISNRRLSKLQIVANTTSAVLASKQISSTNEPSTLISIIMRYKILLLMICVPFVLFFLTYMFCTIFKRKRKASSILERTQSIPKECSTYQRDLFKNPQATRLKMDDDEPLVNPVSTSSNYTTSQLSLDNTEVKYRRFDGSSTLSAPQHISTSIDIRTSEVDAASTLDVVKSSISDFLPINNQRTSCVSSVSQPVSTIYEDNDSSSIHSSSTEDLSQFSFGNVRRHFEKLSQRPLSIPKEDSDSSSQSKNIYLTELIEREKAKNVSESIYSTDEEGSCL